MEKFTKDVQGSISLFLSMVILLLVILEGFLIDGSKVLAAKMLMSSAGDMTLNAGLTHYEAALKDIYGLFAVSETEEELTANLKKHFQKTLGESAGMADEGYVDSMLSYIENSIKNGWDGEEAGRLLDLELGSDFSVKGVAGSELSQPYVIKSQIREYMKYRGPASLGYGMLEKIHAFKELDKQQKTMEDKLNYEMEMSEVQKACEDAYENIEQYNRLLEGSLAPLTVEADSLSINKNMREAILAAWCYSAAKRDYRYDKNWKQNVSVSGHNVEQAVRSCSNRDAMVTVYEAATAALETDFSRHPYGTMCAIKVTIGYQNDFENYTKLYTTWQNYLKYYEKEMKRLQKELDDLDEDDDDSDILDAMDELEEELREYEEIYEEAETQIDQFKEVLDTAKQTLMADIDSRMGTVVREINRLYQDAERLTKLGDAGNKALDDVIKAMDQLKALGAEWQTSIDDLSNGDIKTSMQLDYSNKAEMLDEEKIRILQEKLVNGITYGESLKNAIKATMAVTFKPFEGEKTKYADWLRLQLEGTVYGNDTLANSSMDYRGFSVDEWTENAERSQVLSDTSCTMYLIDSGGGKTNAGNIQMDLSAYQNNMDNISARNDEFFKYLERVCPKSDAESESKKDAENAKKELLEKGKSENLEPEGDLPDLPADVTGASGEIREKFIQTDRDAKDKDVSENAKKNSESSAKFISKVGDLLQDGRDKMYITEYATEMFSYYTIDKMKASDQKTLSGYPLCKENNKMYQAEVEYILWGNPSGKEDVKYTMATIFGIRFLLNSLYAFTGDPEIRQISLALATSIAGWTGFGVPLVQSVIILAFALAETAHDMGELKEGKSVPIYKSTSNWCIKPSGYSKQEIIDVVTNAQSAAKTYLFEQLDHLTEATKEEFRTKLNEYKTDTIDDVISAATAAVLSPIEERVLGLVNVVTPSREQIGAQLEESVQMLEKMVASEEESVMKTAKQKAIAYFRTNVQRQVFSTLAEIQNSDMSNEQITERIDALFASQKKPMKKALHEVVSPLVEELSGQVENALDSGNEALQQKTSEALDQMLIRVNCGISFADTSSVDVDGAKGRTSGAAALTMNYKEYLWLFIAVKSVENEDDIMRRMGNLIHANISLAGQNPVAGFDISQAYTFIEVDATADLSTTFFAMPVPVSGGGSVTLGNDKYSIGYRGVLGY